MAFFDPVQLARKAMPLVVTLLVLIATSLASDPLERQLASQTDVVSTGEMSRLSDSTGQGMILGLLGGFRTIVADFVWIRANLAWMDREPVETLALINLTTTIDPGVILFWRDGARMIIYDFAHWQISEMGGFITVPEAVRERLFEQEALRGLEFLDRALEFNPDHPSLLMEKAMVYQNKLHDYLAAGELYEKAARQPGAIWTMGEMAGVMYIEAGADERALAWLEEYLPRLPSQEEDPRANRQFIEDLIQALKAGEL